MTRTLEADSDKLFMTWVAESGLGKTTAMLSIAKQGRVAYFDFENRLKHRTLRNHGIPVENIDVYRPKTFTAAWAALDAVDKDGGYIATVWDSATELQFALLQEQRQTAPNAKQVDHYTVVNLKHKELMRRCRDSGRHTLVSTTVRRDVDDAGVAFNPNVSPGFGSDLRAMSDVVVSMQLKDNPHAAEGIDRIGIFRTIGPQRGKDGLSLVPGGIMANPSAERLLGLLDETLDLSTDEATIAMQKRLAAG